jgi:hypothetical protein
MCQILNIKQTRTVAGYINKFDDLRHQLLLHDPSASDVFFVTHFIEGLKNDIRSVIALHRPVDMDTVSSLAMMQEEENENGKKKIIQSMNHPVGIHGKPMLLTRLKILQSWTLLIRKVKINWAVCWHTVNPKACAINVAQSGVKIMCVLHKFLYTLWKKCWI